MLNSTLCYKLHKRRMNSRLLHRTSSILFALGHTIGFRTFKPEWGIAPLIASA
ncbi:MAG: hypothetical protein NVSMB3_14600 [Acidobacteriaceae bacterium]